MDVSSREHPLFLMFMQLALTSIFKSYPTVGDATLYLAFLPVWSDLHRCKLRADKHFWLWPYRTNTGLPLSPDVPVLRNIFLVTCTLLACSALFPVLWHLWIYAGSANSNFFYAVTLLFTVAQVGAAAVTINRNRWSIMCGESLQPLH